MPISSSLRYSSSGSVTVSRSSVFFSGSAQNTRAGTKSERSGSIAPER
jgi:hypothetical protein